jgi:hypothetical protein
MFNNAVSSKFIKTIYGISSRSVGSGKKTSTLMTFDTSKAGSANTHVILPLVATGEYAMTVFWGDGTSDYINAFDDAAVDHTYPAVGIYDVEILGRCWGWRYANAGDKLKITAIKRWGSQFRIGNAESYFQGCSNLTITANDTLDLTGTTTFKNMFRACIVLTQIPSLNTWNTAKYYGYVWYVL